jgi:ABC-type phosphate/phosphonate transport system ATPase subunit
MHGSLLDHIYFLFSRVDDEKKYTIVSAFEELDLIEVIHIRINRLTGDDSQRTTSNID